MTIKGSVKERARLSKIPESSCILRYSDRNFTGICFYILNSNFKINIWTPMRLQAFQNIMEKIFEFLKTCSIA